MKPLPQHFISPTVGQAPVVPHGLLGGGGGGGVDFPATGFAETVATSAMRPSKMDRMFVKLKDVCSKKAGERV